MRSQMGPAHALLTLALACGDSAGDSATASSAGSAGFTSTATTATTAAASDTEATTSDSGTTSTSPSTSTSNTTTDGAATSTSTSGEMTVGASESEGSSTTGEPCSPDEDICCLMEGQVPPHALLDAFLDAYPPAAMPKSVAAVQAFEPVADGHAMAWSDENVGNELVDAENGGVIEANIVAGREVSRAAAEAALPAGSTLLDVREDPVIIEDLGTNAPCIGVGWGWGSLLFRAEDTSIGELVYLYIGFCSAGDVEAFFYSDQAVEICAPIPG
jgi:hypothetical protein